MPENFTQYLILFLIMLLFGEKYLGVLIKKWFGVDTKNGYTELEKKIDALENNHLHDIKERLTSLETKTDIIMRHLKI